MENIARALQKYHRAKGCFPPAYIADKSGKPMHSWRVLLLPDLDIEDYYKKYDLAEPWNGPNNTVLCASRPTAFVCLSDREGSMTSPSLTNYIAVVGKNAAWLGDKPRKLADFGNKAADTIMVIESANSGVAWSEPKDLSLDTLTATDAKPTPSSNHGPQSNFIFTFDDANGAYAAMADGSVRYLSPASFSPDRLPKLLQIGGCDEGQIASAASSYGILGCLNWFNITALAALLISVLALLTRAARSDQKKSIANAS
jgi:hypothetical protein